MLVATPTGGSAASADLISQIAPSSTRAGRFRRRCDRKAATPLQSALCGAPVAPAARCSTLSESGFAGWLARFDEVG